MNTVWADRDGLHDELRDAAGLAAWLQAVAGRFRELRDGLRGLAAAVTADPRARAAGTGTPDVAAAVRAVNAACARAPLWSRLTWAGSPGAPARTLRSAGTGPEAALSWIAEE